MVPDPLLYRSAGIRKLMRMRGFDMAKHPKHCEEAVHNKCICQACNGALHQWRWCLEAAREQTGEQRLDRRRQLESSWTAAEQNGNPAQRAEVAVNLGVIDIVDWLAEDYQAAIHQGDKTDSTVEYLGDRLSNLVGDKVRDEIDQLVGPSGPSTRPNPKRVGLANHFWQGVCKVDLRGAAGL